MKEPKKTFTIKDWNASDRPREKLIQKGVFALSNTELLAILLNSGNKNETAVDLARRILSSCDNNLLKLSKLTLSDLQKFNGVGSAKAIHIKAALELSKRIRLEKATHKTQITCSNDIYEVFAPIIGDIPHEEFWVLHLNRKNEIIEQQLVSKGGVSGTLVDVKIILKKSLELLANAIILVHNHPTGHTQPSKEDRLITEKTKQAALSIDVKTLDHIIVGEKAYFSFADEGIL